MYIIYVYSKRKCSLLFMLRQLCVPLAHELYSALTSAHYSEPSYILRFSVEISTTIQCLQSSSSSEAGVIYAVPSMNDCSHNNTVQ